MRADGIACDGHGFEHSVGVAFQHGAIHERARVALVGVADDILGVASVVRGKLPLHAGREACAAAAAKAGGFHEVDDLLRRHAREHFAERLIPVHADIFFDVLGIDDAAVAERNAHLGLVESRIGQRRDLVFCVARGGLVVHKVIDDATLEQMLLDDLGDILLRDAAVERTLGIHNHDRAECAQAEAARLHDLDLVGKAVCGQLFFQVFADRRAAGRGTAGTAANEYMRTNHGLPPIISALRR
ncbi:putative uncharacterized protein [Clostridium sp. CAG:1024]|nr:putative uncharacterized protein [Clostridium sp. CAG:1024]